MGRKIVCPHCDSILNEDILKQKGSENTCLVCGGSLSDGDEKEQKEEVDPNKIRVDGRLIDIDSVDMWLEDFDLPDPSKQEKGFVDVVCNHCKRPDFFYYSEFEKINEFFGILKKEEKEQECFHCKYKITNRIFPKRPPEIEIKKETVNTTANQPKCLICGSTNIHKIGMGNKAVSALAFGFLAAGHVTKTYKCNTCGAKF